MYTATPIKIYGTAEDSQVQLSAISGGLVYIHLNGTVVKHAHCRSIQYLWDYSQALYLAIFSSPIDFDWSDYVHT